MVNKLKYLIHTAHVSRADIARELGYKHVDYVTHLLRGVRKIKPEKQKIIDKMYEGEARKIALYVDNYVPGSFDKEAFDELVAGGEKSKLKKSAEPFEFKLAEYEGEIDEIEKFLNTKGNSNVVKIVKKKDIDDLTPYIDAVGKTNSVGADKFLMKAYDIIEESGDSELSDDFIDSIT